jgi:hypothetical protein
MRKEFRVGNFSLQFSDTDKLEQQRLSIGVDDVGFYRDCEFADITNQELDSFLEEAVSYKQYRDSLKVNIT